MFKKKVITILALLSVLLCLCNNTQAKAEIKPQENLKEMYIPENEKDYIQKVYQEKIVIPNIKKIYSFLYISDTHVIIKSRDEIGGVFGNTDKRIDMFRNCKGKSSAEQFPYWIQMANNNNVNALLMGGDIIDYLSDENVDYVKNNLEKLKVPYLYTMGNHEYCNPWKTEASVKLQSLFKNNDTEVQSLDFGEFIVVSLNDAVEIGLGKISEKALNEFKEIYRLNKPIIIISHVPLCTQNSNVLKEDTIKRWKSSIVLEENCNSNLDNSAKEFMQMITDKNSPVVAVLAGHLHFYHKDLLNNKVVQLVSDISSKGNGMLITVEGEK